MGKCTIENCRKPIRARGWCSTHWSRWYRTGHPLGSKPRPTSLELFLGKVEQTGSCWIWKGCRNNNEYGWCRRSESKLLLAHRVSYELFVGPIPEGLQVLHHCDVPWCVNPAHLFLGTQQDNAKDMVTKGRNRPSYTNKLPWVIVEEIRRRYLAGETNQSSLAREYLVNSSTINCIIHNKCRMGNHDE